MVTPAPKAVTPPQSGAKGYPDTSGEKQLGASLGEALINAACAVSPTDDARGYVQQSMLPVLGPAIEQLLHHVHETGELQRALQAQAERDGKPKKRDKAKDTHRDPSHTSSAKADEGSHKPDTPEAYTDEPEEAVGLDPLAWLADYLRQHQTGTADKHKAEIDQRIAELIQKQQEEEAAALAALEAAEAEAEAAAEAAEEEAAAAAAAAKPVKSK